MSYYSVQDGLLFKSYLPGHPSKRSTFRHLRVLTTLRTCGAIVTRNHDRALSGGHLLFKPTYGKIRQKQWWPTISGDIRKWYKECQACQRRKAAHNRPKLPTGHVPVERSFQRNSVDLVEYKSKPVSRTSYVCFINYGPSHTFRIANGSTEQVRRNSSESVHQPTHQYFCHPGNNLLWPRHRFWEQGNIPGATHARIQENPTYRPQGNSVSDRVHSTMHSMLAMHTSIDQDNWASLLPSLVQMGYKTPWNQPCVRYCASWCSMSCWHCGIPSERYSGSDSGHYPHRCKRYL